MNKFLIPLFILLSKECFGQELGLRYGPALSSDTTLTTPLGVGIFFCSEDSAKKYNLILSFDMYRTKRNRELPYASIYNIRFDYAIALLRITSLSDNKKFRIGPMVSYQKTKGHLDTMYGTDLSSHFIGLGMIFNLKIERIFHTALNFDTFLSPEYLLWLSGFNKRYPLTAELNLGVSF